MIIELLVVAELEFEIGHPIVLNVFVEAFFESAEFPHRCGSKVFHHMDGMRRFSEDRIHRVAKPG